MEEVINEAVKLLVEKSGQAKLSDEALRFSQAALNLQHVLAAKANILDNAKRTEHDCK